MSIIALVSCEKQKEPNTATLLVSVPPYVYFVQKIGKERFQVSSLVPANASPHVYEPTPKEVEKHRSAAIWFKIGEPMEKKVEKVFKEMHPEIEIVDLTAGIPLITNCEEGKHACPHHSHESKDLHIWLSPRLAKIQAETIANALIAHFPEHKEEFRDNLAEFLTELDLLDQTVSQLLLQDRGKAILVAHPAFAYFCRDYDLLQIPVEIDGKDPLPQQITHTMQLANEHAVQTMITEPQYSTKGAALIAERLHLRMHSINPYAENYPENILELAQTIAE